MAEQKPDRSNVLFMDEYPQYIERRKVHQALGQLTLTYNADPAQLILFPQREEIPDDAA